MSGQWLFHNGEFVPAKQVALGVSTQALHYGTGVFEGIRSYRSATGDGLSHLISAEAHYERLLDSARLLRMDLPYTAAELVEITAELLRRNDHREDAYVRPIAHKLALEPGTPVGVRLRGVSMSFTISTMPMPRYSKAEGMRCAVTSWRRIPDSSLPARGKICGAYANNALAVDEVEAAGFDDAIFLNQREEVSEASTANIFLVRDGVAATPGPAADILEGITRATAIGILEREAGVPVAQRPIARSELYTADEVFVTGTGCEIVPVIEVDGRRVGTGIVGAATKVVQDTYQRMVRGLDPGRADRLTPVRFD